MVQTCLIIDFLYIYFISLKQGRPVKYELPVWGNLMKKIDTIQYSYTKTLFTLSHSQIQII